LETSLMQVTELTFNCTLACAVQRWYNTSGGNRNL